MSAINLLPKSLREKNKQNSLKRNVYVVTSIILGTYVVVVAGIIGWWVFLSQQDAALATRVTTLSQEVKTHVQAEAVVRQLVDRSKLIQQFLDDRTVTSEHAKNLISTQVAVGAWNYKTAKHTATMTAADAGSIETFVATLKDKYATVKVGRLDNSAPGTWVGDVTFQK